MLNPTTSIVPSDPALADAYTVTEVGKEEINGAPTTKYKVDVDYTKLLASIIGEAGKGATPTPTPDPSLPKIKTNFTLSMYLWVGDTNHYLNKLTEALSIKIESDSSSGLGNLGFDFELTILFKDFDTPITITAPPNAEPLDLKGLGSSSSTTLTGFESLAGGVLGSTMGSSLESPIGMPMGMPSMAMPARPAVGMPKTGSSSGDNVWGLAALGLICVATGSILRRKSLHVGEHSR